jgi:murein L,D-transpeptidase YafK
MSRLGRLAGLGLCLTLLAPQSASALEVVIRPAAEAPSAVAKPKLGNIAERLEARGLPKGAPIYIRIFKEEAALEVWMLSGGRFELFETYPVCKYDGTLGPKLFEGDRQSPEGFYTVAPDQLRWTGRWYRAFDLAFPNPYDADQGRTGSAILIHGGCGSIGCYAMTNAVIDELFELAAEAFDGGQPRFSVHVFPFRMTEANMARHRPEAWASFWRDLRPAYAAFESAHTPPGISVCAGEYRIEAGGSGYDGSHPIARSCEGLPQSRLAGAAPSDVATPAIASVKPAALGMGPLRTRLEEVRKLPPPVEYASVAGSGKGVKRMGRAVIKGGLVVRCSTRLASCRKWVALRHNARPKSTRTASAKKRKTASTTP